MDVSELITDLVETNLEGVRAGSIPDLTHHRDHAELIVRALGFEAGGPNDALRSRILARSWPADARIIPHLVPQIGVTHLLTSSGAHADVAYTSNNWAGSTIAGNWTDDVGIWRVPAVSIPETPPGTNGGWDSSSWVGIDGAYGSNDVLQAGVQQSVAGDGSTTYVAWYEWYAPKVQGSPAYIYQTNIDNLEIQPGDEVFAGIHYRDGKGLVMFGNVDRGHYFDIVIDPPPGASMSGNSVEWIMEAPNSGEPGTSLPRFTPVIFSAAMASPAAAGAPGGDPAHGDTYDIVSNGRTLTHVQPGTLSLTITRNAPPWQGFELAAGGSASGHGFAAVSRVPSSMELWYVGADGSVQDRYWYDTGNWQGFELAPAGSAAPGSSIAAVSRVPSSMELWWVAPNGSVQGSYWYEGSNWNRYELSPAGSASLTGESQQCPESPEAWSCGLSDPTDPFKTATGTRTPPGKVFRLPRREAHR